MSKIRILHMSDLHIAEKADLKGLAGMFEDISFSQTVEMIHNNAYAASYAPRFLMEASRFVHRRQKTAAPLDAVLVTGDIATTGSFNDLRKAWQFFDSEESALYPGFNTDGFPTLKPSGVKSITMPGNHDRYANTSGYGYSPGSRNYDQIFPPFHPKKVSSTIVANASELAVGVVCGDLTLDSQSDAEPTGFLLKQICAYGQGKATKKLCEEMREETYRVAQKITKLGKKPVVIWAVHFPPEFPNVGHIHKLIDSALLIREADACQIPAILCGHTHIPVAYQTPGMKTRVFCNGTTSQRARTGNFVQLFEFELASNGRVRIGHTYFRYDEKITGNFVELG